MGIVTVTVWVNHDGRDCIAIHCKEQDRKRVRKGDGSRKVVDYNEKSLTHCHNQQC